MAVHTVLKDQKMLSLIFHHLLGPATATERLNESLIAAAGTCTAFAEVALNVNWQHISDTGAFVEVSDYRPKVAGHEKHKFPSRPYTENGVVVHWRWKRPARLGTCACHLDGQTPTALTGGEEEDVSLGVDLHPNAGSGDGWSGKEIQHKSAPKTTPSTNLPLETWTEIVNHVTSGPACKHGPSIIDGIACAYGCSTVDERSAVALMLTCHFFHDIVQPMVDKTLSIKGDADGGMTSRHRCSMHLFDEERRSRVRRSILPLLKNVLRLNLRDVFITPDVVALLRNNEHSLRTLRLYRCKYHPHAADDLQSDPFCPSKLIDVEWSGACLPSTKTNPARPAYFLNAPLEALTINRKHLTGRHLPFCDSLIKLDFTDPWSNDLTQFLGFCPKLKELRAEPALLHLPIFEDTLLPNLQHLICDAPHAIALLPGRPIRSITTTAAIGLFTNPLPGLEALCLSDLKGGRDGSDTITAMITQCPNLRKLELRADTANASTKVMKTWILTRMPSDIAKLHQLQSLQILWQVHLWKNDPYFKTIVRLPLGHLGADNQSAAAWRQREQDTLLLLKRKDNCPDLHEVCLEPGRAWTFGRLEGVWTPGELEGAQTISRLEGQKEWTLVRRRLPFSSAS